MIGLTRTKGAMQKGKTPIYWEELEQMISYIDTDSLSGIRDKAILLLGFWGRLEEVNFPAWILKTSPDIHRELL